MEDITFSKGIFTIEGIRKIFEDLFYRRLELDKERVVFTSQKQKKVIQKLLEKNPNENNNRYTPDK